MPNKSMFVAPELQEEHIPVVKKCPKVKQYRLFILNCKFNAALTSLKRHWHKEI